MPQSERSIGAGGGIRTHTPLRGADFKSAASTVSPPRHVATMAEYRSQPPDLTRHSPYQTGGVQRTHNPLR